MLLLHCQLTTIHILIDNTVLSSIVLLLCTYTLCICSSCTLLSLPLEYHISILNTTYSYFALHKLLCTYLPLHHTPLPLHIYRVGMAIAMRCTTSRSMALYARCRCTWELCSSTRRRATRTTSSFAPSSQATWMPRERRWRYCSCWWTR